jgi:hypothetical protein
MDLDQKQSQEYFEQCVKRILADKDVDWNQPYVINTVVKIMKRRGMKAGEDLAVLMKCFSTLDFFEKCKNKFDEKRYQDLFQKLSYLNTKNLNPVVEYGTIFLSLFLSV